MRLRAALLSFVVSAALSHHAVAETERPLRLDDSPSLTLLRPYRHAAGHPDTALSHYLRGRFGEWTRAALRDDTHWFRGDHDSALVVWPSVVPPWLQQLDGDRASTLIATTGCGAWGTCSYGVSYPAAAFAELWSTLAPKLLDQPWWVCRERPVLVMRHGSEQSRFVLLHCDGSVPDGALEQLSILARPNGVPRPTELPPAPTPRAPKGEWVDGVRLLHPRLLWVLHRIALAHPWRSIYLYSGYRRGAGSRTGHRSQHHVGRALDIGVQGVSNEQLLELCRKLPDVSCGYYPNNKFVHVDVRARGSGKGFWIDASTPGAPSRYVDAWPSLTGQSQPRRQEAAGL
jgi:hypothetical protein